MKNAKKKFPITKSVLAAFTSGVFLTMIAIVLGQFYGNPNSSKLFWQIPTCMIIIIVMVRLYRRYVRVRVYAFLRRKNKMRFWKRCNTKEKCTDATKLYRNMVIANIMVATYIALLLVGSFMILFFRAASGIGISMILSFYIIFSVCYMFWYLIFFNEEEDEEEKKSAKEPENLMSRQEYPLLYEMAEDVKTKLGVKKKLKLYVNDGVIAVTETFTAVELFLNVVELSILTKEELKQILIHEFAHVVNGDTKDEWMHNLLYRLRTYICKDQWKNLAMFLFSEPLEYVERCRYRYKEMVSRAHEVLADKKMLEMGDAQTTANALGKLAMYKMHCENPYMYLNPDLSGKEEVQNHPTQEEIAEFKRELVKNETEWRRIISLEIPRNLESHPIPRERIKACGVSSYDIHTEETDRNYKKEIQKLVEWEETVFQKEEEENFKSEREQYEERMEKMEAFQKESMPYETFSVGELYEFAEAFQVTDDEKAIEIVDVILKKVPRHTLALGLKGQILLRLGKEEGLEYLFEIAKSHEREADYEYITDIQEYAYRYGRQDVLKRCEEEFKDVEDNIYEWECQVGCIQKEDVLKEANLSEKQIQRIRNIAELNVFEDIEEVLCVQKIVDEETIYLYVIVSEKSDVRPMNFIACNHMRNEMIKEMNNVIVQSIKKNDKTYEIVKEQVPNCCIYRRETK